MMVLPIAHKGINLVVTRAKAPQLHLLPVLDLLRVTVTPLNRHVRVGISIYEHVEGAVAIELWQERDGSCDLSEDGLNLVLNLLFGFVFWYFTITVTALGSLCTWEGGHQPWSRVLLICRLRRGSLLARLVEKLDLTRQYQASRKQCPLDLIHRIATARYVRLSPYL